MRCSLNVGQKKEHSEINYGEYEELCGGSGICIISFSPKTGAGTFQNCPSSSLAWSFFLALKDLRYLVD
jgi:hypothetical protein